MQVVLHVSHSHTYSHIPNLHFRTLFFYFKPLKLNLILKFTTETTADVVKSEDSVILTGCNSHPGPFGGSEHIGTFRIDSRRGDVR